jgi:hypothetical protein
VNRELVRHVDVLFGNEEDFSAALGYALDGADENLLDLEVARYEELLGRVLADRPNLTLVASTLRQAHTASVNDWNAVCITRDGFHVGPTFDRLEILDRVGGGDSFASGLIFGLLEGMEMDRALAYGVAHGALAMTTPGDTSTASRAEVERLVGACAEGRAVTLELWLVAGTWDSLRAGDDRERRGHVREVAAALDASNEIHVRDRARPRAVRSPESIRRLFLEANAADDCVGVAVWMHVLAGEDVGRRPVGAAEAAAAPPHAVQPRVAVGGDRHGVHEPEPVGARRPRARVHADAHAYSPEDGSPATGATPRSRGAWARGRAACGWRELQRLSVARFGDNMRHVAVTEGDKVEAQLRLGVSCELLRCDGARRCASRCRPGR